MQLCKVGSGPNKARICFSTTITTTNITMTTIITVVPESGSMVWFCGHAYSQGTRWQGRGFAWRRDDGRPLFLDVPNQASVPKSRDEFTEMVDLWILGG